MFFYEKNCLYFFLSENDVGPLNHVNAFIKFHDKRIITFSNVLTKKIQPTLKSHYLKVKIF